MHVIGSNSAAAQPNNRESEQISIRKRTKQQQTYNSGGIGSESADARRRAGQAESSKAPATVEILGHESSGSAAVTQENVNDFIA